MTSARKIKLKLEQRKPRNPLVVPARQRKAGAHRKGTRSERQQAARELRRALEGTGH
jgi:hypothetical protein